MSLLLEALKKAELAKQLARAAEASGSAQPATPVITREKLPDITQPLEILTDDLPHREQGQAAAGAHSELSLQPDLSAPEPEALPYPAGTSGDVERAQALVGIAHPDFREELSAAIGRIV